jgi:hypothetical protein
MEKNPLNQGVSTDTSTGVAPVSRERVHARARELALIAGRTPPQVAQADYEQATRELTGETEMDRQAAMLGSFPESKRWNPAPGSSGRQAPESASEDEDEDEDADEEGRSKTGQLVDEGAGEAERDQLIQAAGKSDRRDA